MLKILILARFNCWFAQKTITTDKGFMEARTVFLNQCALIFFRGALTHFTWFSALLFRLKIFMKMSISLWSSKVFFISRKLHVLIFCLLHFPSLFYCCMAISRDGLSKNISKSGLRALKGWEAVSYSRASQTMGCKPIWGCAIPFWGDEINSKHIGCIYQN